MYGQLPVERSQVLRRNKSKLRAAAETGATDVPTELERSEQHGRCTSPPLFSYSA
jgi:hypothetical protein